MYSWINKKLETRDTKKCGKGVFAKDNIKKNERLAVFGGYVMTIEQELNLPKEISDYAHQIDDDLVIGINCEKDISLTDHFNHSCEPNAGFKGQIILIAMRDIVPNEEITFDYAMTLAEVEESVYVMDCKCNAFKCRKKITDSDWRNPILQQKYEGYFQSYIYDKILQIKSKIS